FAHKSVQEYWMKKSNFAVMENSGGLSTYLKQKIAVTKVAVIGNEADKLIAQAIGRLGFVNVATTPDSHNLPQCDVAICTCTEKEDYKAVITRYDHAGIPVICTFNFGIGACVTVVMPGTVQPHFLKDKADNDTVKSMLEYTSGYSIFWHIPRNSWVEEAMKYICSPEVSASIGKYTMTAMAAHLLIAIVAGNKVKTYPKFYLSTIANDIN
ncbi:MAG: hypothetical protein K2G13_06255, partial [Muribaculaceae bacterium]|nr:hypothetical protein [Muribaculaceae bacterium]